MNPEGARMPACTVGSASGGGEGHVLPLLRASPTGLPEEDERARHEENAVSDYPVRFRRPGRPWVYRPLLPLLLALTTGLAFWCLAFLLLSNPPGLFLTRQDDARRTLHISLQADRAPELVPGSGSPPLPGAEPGSRNPDPPAAGLDSHFARAPARDPNPIHPQVPVPEPASGPPWAPALQVPENPVSTTGAARLTDQALTPPTETTRSAEIPPVTTSSPETLSRAALDQAISGNLVYPPLARKRGISGVSLWRLHISAAGTLESLQLVTGSGSGLLDEEATRALQSAFPLPSPPGSPVILEYRIIFKIK